MNIKVDAKAMNIDVVALTTVDAATVKPVQVYGKKETKLVDGVPVFRVPDAVVRVDGVLDRSVSLKVKALPESIDALSVHHLVGAVSITPFISDADHRIHYSVLADALD